MLAISVAGCDCSEFQQHRSYCSELAHHVQRIWWKNSSADNLFQKFNCDLWFPYLNADREIKSDEFAADYYAALHIDARIPVFTEPSNFTNLICITWKKRRSACIWPCLTKEFVSFLVSYQWSVKISTKKQFIKHASVRCISFAFGMQDGPCKVLNPLILCWQIVHDQLWILRKQCTNP